MKNLWNQLPTPAKVVLIVLGVVALALLLLWSFGGTQTLPEDDNSYKVLQGENNILRQQNDTLRKQREESVVKAEALEMERDGLRVELERFGKQAAAGVQKQKEAAEQYEKDINIIGMDVPKSVRCQRYCSNRAAEGFPCRPNPDAYCQLHYGDGGN